MTRPALFVLLLLLVFASLAQADQPAWKAVWRSEEVQEKVSLSGRVRTMISFGGRAREATATVAAREGKLRLDYRAGDRQWTLLDNGRNLIRLGEKSRRARVLPRPALAFDRALAERNYTARRTGKSTVAGRPTQVIEIVPRGGGRAVWRLWVDQATGFVLKREHYNVEGKLTTATEYLSVDFGARPNPELFVVPPGFSRETEDGLGTKLGLEQLALRAGFEVRRPGYLPPGYVFLGGSLRERGERFAGRAARGGNERREGPRPGRNEGRRGGPRFGRDERRWEGPPREHAPGKVAELRYTDGLRLLSILQRPATGARAGKGETMDLVDRGSEKVLRHVSDGRAIMVVGDLTQAELVRVAKGVE